MTDRRVASHRDEGQFGSHALVAHEADELAEASAHDRPMVGDRGAGLAQGGALGKSQPVTVTAPGCVGGNGNC